MSVLAWPDKQKLVFCSLPAMQPTHSQPVAITTVILVRVAVLFFILLPVTSMFFVEATPKLNQ